MLFAFDGTNNKDNPGDLNDSNVVKFYDAYLSRKFYQAGVGSGGWLDRIIGGLTGWGGKRKVKRALVELEKVLEVDQKAKIDVVGFSRGAALAIDFCNEVHRVYGNRVKIRFLALFDAVASFGIPGNDINLGYTLSLPECVKECFHAMALDERRELFPLNRVVQDGSASHIVECWFRGFHSDIGGGNGNPELSNIPLVWMIGMADSAGMCFAGHLVAKFISRRNQSASCKRPLDLIPNSLRNVARTDYVHHSVTPRKLACKGFMANNPPSDCPVI